MEHEEGWKIALWHGFLTIIKKWHPSIKDSLDIGMRSP
jgi:hypothetical protein